MPQKGQHHSLETRHRMSIAHKEYRAKHPMPTGDKNPNWKGGRWKTHSGWAVSLGNGSFQYEHRIIAEKALGRKLKTSECIHHINCDPLDNRNCNLLICSKGYHNALHYRMSNLYAMEHFNRQ